MKTLVISDTHLTHKFDQRKFNFLHQIISEADQVILNGDFWDAWIVDLDKFLTSKWNQLFPLLIQKKAVYVHGNHDPKAYCDNRIEKFSVTNADEYHLKINDTEFIFTHGHLLLKNKRSKLVNIYGKFMDSIEFTPAAKLIHLIMDTIAFYSFKLLGQSGIAKLRVLKESNRIMKTQRRDNNASWLICGDSHLPEVDLEDKYANSGCILQGKASYLIIENNNPQLYTTRY